MNKYTLNFINGSVNKTRNKLGLNIHKRGFINGFTIESSDIESAKDILTGVDAKWNKWVDTYNQWALMPDKSKWKAVKTSQTEN